MKSFVVYAALVAMLLGVLCGCSVQAGSGQVYRVKHTVIELSEGDVPKFHLMAKSEQMAGSPFDVAVVDRSDVSLLLEEKPAKGVRLGTDESQADLWKQAYVWAHTYVGGEKSRGGHATGVIGVRGLDGRLEVRIDLVTEISGLNGREAVAVHGKTFYEGPAGNGRVVVFIAPLSGVSKTGLVELVVYEVSTAE